jgi:hypothetical protein
VTGAALFAAAGAQAHGEQAPTNPWVEGSRVLFEDPVCLLALAVLALWMAQPHQPNPKAALYGGLTGLVLGALLAAAGFGRDVTLVLLASALVIGVLVAWARPWPAALRAAVAAVVAAGVMLMLAPAETAPAGYRWTWLAGVLLVTVLLFGNTLALLRVLIGRRPGPVRQMLLRVAGSWLATAAVLALALEWSRRSL